MPLLDDIYNNRYEPQALTGPETRAICREVNDIWDQIEPCAGHELVDALQERLNQLDDLGREDAFRAGFRLGAGLMAELL